MPVSLALLGSGLFASIAYLPAIFGNSKDVILHTVWSRSQSSAESLLEKCKELGISPLPTIQFGDSGLNILLKDKSIDGVMLVLPITAQPPLVIKCLEAGKHVLCEKPLHKDVKHAKELVEEYEKRFKPKGLIFRTAENWAHEPVLHWAASKLREPALGPVLYWQLGLSNVVKPGSHWHATSWRTIPDYQGGFILDGGVHQGALLRIVLPIPPSTILSHATLHRAHLPPHDTFVAIAAPPISSHTPAHGYEVTSGVNQDLPHKVEDIPAEIGTSAPFGTILMTWAQPDLPNSAPAGMNALEIVCLHGVVSISWPDKNMKAVITAANGSGVVNEEKEEKQSGVKVEIGMYARAIEAVKEGKELEEPNWADPRDCLWDLAWVEACLQSGGKSVDIEGLIKG
ncbi:hypothetical protein M231_02470 [Tremella mesenterica]|uniref:Gfo/Idh/MocA-like oxidoreductase N-terminal domain-containing protein n=1 Tax=Tremella mesenterica TaxID=5217 RepID=A0A4Q1BQI7_TREME|nr:hypothetical protein M231_02470 [Tremella mesenterica]